MTVDQLGDYLKQHWPAIREQLLNGTYEPKPVRRVEIPKPDGGMRKLGIPTVLDRFIQQAVMQVLQRQWNPTFSQYSYGFRPRRSAHHAVAQAQQYIAQGHGWVIDLDLEKFFDRVNHDKLMSQIAKRVEDKRLLKLTRAFLNAGVMENGLDGPVGPVSRCPLIGENRKSAAEDQLTRLTRHGLSQRSFDPIKCAVFFRGQHEAAGIHRPCRWCGGCVAARFPCAGLEAALPRRLSCPHARREYDANENVDTTAQGARLCRR
jgi:hypothetical protein